MPPKKKKAGGEAAKGEKIFKNLCAACHSLSVMNLFTLRLSSRLILLDLHLGVCQDKTLLQERASVIHLHSHQRLLSNGLTVTWTSGSRLQLSSPLVMPWLSQESQVRRTELTS